MSESLYQKIDTPFFTDCLRNQIPVSFVKMGDGEYACALGEQGQNCDGDVYFPELGSALRKAFLDLAQHENVYIGRWHMTPGDRHVANWFNDYFEQQTKKSSDNIPWVNYHCFIKDSERAQKSDIFNFVKAIQEDTRKKIYVCNEWNARMCDVFRAEHVLVPPNCWITKYDSVMNDILSKLTPDAIVLFSAGICTKVAIANLLQLCPTLTCLDIGSNFDCLARGKSTRAYQGNFFQEFDYYKDLLPRNWLESTELY